jgi:hypothetical protein
MIDYLIFTLTLLTQSLFIGKGFFPFIFFLLFIAHAIEGETFMIDYLLFTLTLLTQIYWFRT